MSTSPLRAVRSRRHACAAIALLVAPTFASAADSAFFDLNGLVLSGLAVLVGAFLLVLAAVLRNGQLAIAGLATVLVTVLCLVVGPVIEQREHEANWKVLAADESAHAARFAAFCGERSAALRVLAAASAAEGRDAALRVTCRHPEDETLCFGLDHRLWRRWSSIGGAACRTTAVGAIHVIDPGFASPPAPTDILVPVCGAASRDPAHYEAYELLSTKVLRSATHDGQGPMARARFHEVELTLVESATARPLAVGTYYEAVNAHLSDANKPLACKGFEDEAIELLKAVLPRS